MHEGRFSLSALKKLLLVGSKDGFEKWSYQRSKSLIYNKQDDKGQDKQPKKTDEDFEQFECQPQGYQPG